MTVADGSSPAPEVRVLHHGAAKLALHTLRPGVDRPLLLLHGLRGVIESAEGSSSHAWRRYLDLATQGLKPVAP